MANEQPANSMAALMQILSLFQGKESTETTSGKTSTSSVSQEGLNAMLKQALESNQGLASVMGGEKAAGLYNSSTNALLSNDLSTRLAAQIAANNRTEVTGPSTKTVSSPAAINAKNAPMLAGVIGGGSALQNLMQSLNSPEGQLVTGAGKVALNKDARGLLGKGYDKASEYVSSLMAPGQEESLASLMTAQAPQMSYDSSNVVTQFMPQQFDMSVPEAGMSTAINEAAQTFTNSMPTSGESSLDALSQLLGSGNTVQQVGEAAAPVVAEAGGAIAGAAGNFPTASASGTTISTSVPSSSGNVDSLAEAAPSSVVSGLTTSTTSSVDASAGFDSLSPNIGNSAAELAPDYSGAFGLESTDSGLGGAGSMGVGYDTGSGLVEAGGSDALLGGASGSGSYTGIGSAGSGSMLGYVGPIMSALNAQKNPDGAQGTDYRNAVGGAVLNYFGLGLLTPIANVIATPLLDAAGDAGYKALGNAGIVASDPVGALISGRLDLGDVVTSGLDPANIFGGNEGGSVGATVAAGVDPIGAALGGEGAFGVVSDAVNSVDSAISGGRVVCTELALAGHISVAKYQAVLAPGITLTGRILLGYHILGIPAVRKLRRDPAFVSRALPYVNAYLDHKLGHWNLKGFLIKNIGEPLCYLLSFFNTDPEAYKTLYPYRRTRNGT